MAHGYACYYIPSEEIPPPPKPSLPSLSSIRIEMEAELARRRAEEERLRLAAEAARQTAEQALAISQAREEGAQQEILRLAAENARLAQALTAINAPSIATLVAESMMPAINSHHDENMAQHNLSRRLLIPEIPSDENPVAPSPSFS